MTLFFIFMSFAIFACPFSAHAKTADKLKQVEQQLNQQQEQAQALDAKAQETSSSLNDLRHKLIAATAAYQAKAEEQDRLETKLDELVQSVDSKNQALKNEKHKLNLLTDALIELSRQPAETWFLRTGLTTDYIHRAILLRSIIPHIKDQVDVYAHDVSELNDLQAQLAEQKHMAIAAQENLMGQQHDLDQLIKARQGFLQRTQAQKEAINRQLVSLTSEAKDLRQLLDKVAPKYSPKTGPSHGLSSDLHMPVAGNLVRQYGARDSDGVTSQGLTYAALPGSPVVAPLDGKVVFVGPFRGYGQIMILQHPGGYHSFLAGFGRIDAEMGQEVAKGEPLGVLPAKSGTKPELYFEWRRNNEAVDPTAEIALSKGK